MARQPKRPPANRPRARHTAARLHELPPTVSVDEAGEMLGISRRSAYRAAARGELPTLRLGRRLLVPTPRLLALLGATGGDPRNRDGLPPASPDRRLPTHRLRPPTPASSRQPESP